MPKLKQTDTEQVTAHIQKLSPSIRPAVEYLRKVILSVSDEIKEHIKWNSPAFYYSGAMKDFDPKEYKRDILVMNLRNNKLMCVLPTGQNIKTNVELLTGDYTDGRRLVTFEDLNDIQANEQKFRDAINEWLNAIDK